MKESFRKKGGWWVITQFVLMGTTVALGPLAGPHWAGPWAPILGGSLFMLGAGVGIGGAWTLGTNRTAYPVPTKDAQLIQHGIYGHIRHPLYTSLILLGLGWALSWHSGAALVSAAIMTIHLRLKANLEERHLEQQFPTYAAYRQRVPPFLPRLH